MQTGEEGLTIEKWWLGWSV